MLKNQEGTKDLRVCESKNGGEGVGVRVRPRVWEREDDDAI